VQEVERALHAARLCGVIGVLGIGGGSVIDAAKLLRVAYRYGVRASEALGDLEATVRRPAGAPCALVAVPTTAGTGAEVSQSAILTDEQRGRKVAARGPALVPDVALIDPQLALSLTPRRTAETGFDVIAHAVETYLSLAATPVTDVLARSALGAVPAALVRAVDHGDDLEARATLAMYAWLMGYNLAHASTCLPHRMQYPVGALTDTSHQIGLAAIYPAWVRAVSGRHVPRILEVTNLIRASLSAVEVTDSAGEPGTVFRGLLERIGIAVTLRDLGLTEELVPRLVDTVEGRVELDPLRPSVSDIDDLFRQSLK
jgi:alcohol dehydrogenase class IV